MQPGNKKAGKFVVDGVRGKACNLWKARENM